jgi:small-conductance mechanosensitive channel
MNVLTNFQALSVDSHWATYAGGQLVLELACLLISVGVAFGLGRWVHSPRFGGDITADGSVRGLKSLVKRFGQILYPALVLIFIKLSGVWLEARGPVPLLALAYWLVSVILLVKVINTLVINKLAVKLALSIGVLLLTLKSLGFFDDIIAVLDTMAFQSGYVRVSVYDGLRVLVLGSLLFWLVRLSNTTGKKMIRNQANLDSRSKELFSKLFEIAIFTLAALLLLQVMGINLTTLAVFGGALGVGLGFGLQSIASNFISGVIILLDRSVTLGDFIELEDGRSGRVTELSLRATTLETYDGKDIVVPNETFIASSFINWTHKDNKQRYRVDFSVAYHTDIRALVEVVKQVVGEHPQVITGENVPFEERPDCEIDSFGDSGINMFVEFWMEGIDDGKNRVGGDLLLIILEAIRDHGYEIPFPQREVRILNGPTKL